MAKKSNAAQPAPRDEVAAALQRVGDVFAQGVAALQEIGRALTPADSAIPEIRKKSTVRGRRVARGKPGTGETPIPQVPRTAAGPMVQVKVGGKNYWLPADHDPDDPATTLPPEVPRRVQEKFEAERLARSTGAAIGVHQPGRLAGGFGDGATVTGQARQALKRTMTAGG